MSGLRIEALGAANEADFRAVLGGAGECSQACMCTAHYHEDWERSGRDHRTRMFREGAYDGFLLYDDADAAGWIQCTSVERFLWARSLDTEDGAAGISCVVLLPESRGRGLCSWLFRAAVDELRQHDRSAVYAVGHRLEAYDDPASFHELPASVCEKAGFELVRDHEVCPIYCKRFRFAAT